MKTDHPTLPGILLLWMAWFTPTAVAQNLVPNGSFEVLSGCPTNVNQVSLAPPWSQPTPASSDYFHACAAVYTGANVPHTMAGDQPAQDPTPALGSLNTDPPLELGGDSSPFALATLSGTLDEVELFRRALAPSEIQDLYLAGEAGKCKIDCNGNGVLDAVDLASGSSADLNANGKPDECESFVVSLAGSVGSACGSDPAEVLRINGQSGGPGRSVSLRVGEPIRITISEPPGDASDGRPSLAWVELWIGLPGEADAVELPWGLGFMAFGPPFLATRPALITWNAIGFPSLLGTHSAPGDPPVIPDGAEFELLHLPGGLPQPMSMTLQGLIQDRRASTGVGFSVTNGVMLRIQ